MVMRRMFTLSILLMIVLLSSCHAFRFFYWNYADINDDKKFPALPVLKGEQPFYFNTAPSQFVLQIPASLNVDKYYSGFEQFLSRNETVSFLVIRSDTVIYERYFDHYDANSAITSFSVAKSFVSALIGIAIQEGAIKSADQAVTDYLPDMKDTGFQSVKISDLLNMRSGIRFNESYGSPFALMPKFYYGTQLEKYAKSLKVVETPGKRYEYQSANTLLLTLILEKATGIPVNVYLQDKIWNPLGMESDASWSIDSKKHQTIKSFCCISASTHDYARFGRLYLNKGNWNGKQIISGEWISKSSTVSNDSRDSQGYPYVYSWRVMENGELFAKGVLGQYIFIDPGKKIIIVRLGKASGKVNWPVLFTQITKQL